MEVEKLADQIRNQLSLGFDSIPDLIDIFEELRSELAGVRPSNSKLLAAYLHADVDVVSLWWLMVWLLD